MSSPLTDARLWVVDQLQSLTVPVHHSPAEVMNTPAVAITTGEPWVERATFGTVAVSLLVQILVNGGSSNSSATDQLEALTWEVLQALPTAGTVPAPRITQLSGADVLICEVPVLVSVTEGE